VVVVAPVFCVVVVVVACVVVWGGGVAGGDGGGSLPPQTLETLISAQFQNCSGTPRPSEGIELQTPTSYFGSKPAGKL